MWNLARSYIALSDVTYLVVFVAVCYLWEQLLSAIRGKHRGVNS